MSITGELIINQPVKLPHDLGYALSREIDYPYETGAAEVEAFLADLTTRSTEL